MRKSVCEEHLPEPPTDSFFLSIDRGKSAWTSAHTSFLGAAIITGLSIAILVLQDGMKSSFRSFADVVGVFLLYGIVLAFWSLGTWALREGVENWYFEKWKRGSRSMNSTNLTRARRRVGSVVLLLVLSAFLIPTVALALETKRDGAPLTSVSQVTHVLASHDLPCMKEVVQELPEDPLVTGASICRVSGQKVLILAFADREDREEYIENAEADDLSGFGPSYDLVGETWDIVGGKHLSLLRRIQGAIGGEVERVDD